MPDRNLTQVLSDWRAAARDLAAVADDVALRVHLINEVERLRDEYHRTLGQVIRDAKLPEEDAKPDP